MDEDERAIFDATIADVSNDGELAGADLIAMLVNWALEHQAALRRLIEENPEGCRVGVELVMVLGEKPEQRMWCTRLDGTPTGGPPPTAESA